MYDKSDNYSNKPTTVTIISRLSDNVSQQQKAICHQQKHNVTIWLLRYNAYNVWLGVRR
jgi:hypothetical protein